MKISKESTLKQIRNIPISNIVIAVDIICQLSSSLPIDMKQLVAKAVAFMLH